MNLSQIEIPTKIIKKNKLQYLCSTSIFKDDIILPNFKVFKENYIKHLDLIYGIREKKSEKLHKKGIKNLFDLTNIPLLCEEANRILSAINSDFYTVLEIINQRFSSSHKLSFLLLSFFDKKEIVFLDIETKNLFFETIIITVGIGFFENENFIIEQFTILSDAAEYEILNDILPFLYNKKAFLTFNGKVFDIPFLQGRLAYYSLDYNFLDNFHNFDLLHFSRNVFKNQISSFSLKDIEQNILNKQRKNDINSDEIEIYYSNYLRTNDLKYLNPIIYHNKEDIYTMYLILKKICEIWTK